jgi:hypothetical protein
VTGRLTLLYKFTGTTLFGKENLAYFWSVGDTKAHFSLEKILKIV